MIKTRILSNGNLLLTADNEARQELAEAYAAGGYPRAERCISEELHENMEFVQPEEIGALTDAPILAFCDDLDYPDNDDRILIEGASVYYFGDYAITDPFEQLKNRGRVVFSVAT